MREKIQQVIENEPVAVFMKGTPQFVMCGNSDRALRALRELGASGELEQKLREKLGDGYRESAETRVVDVLQPA
jgi:glutaredoxin-related protein